MTPVYPKKRDAELCPLFKEPSAVSMPEMCDYCDDRAVNHIQVDDDDETVKVCEHHLSEVRGAIDGRAGDYTDQMALENGGWSGHYER